jgi:alpha-L-rhamnosidase
MRSWTAQWITADDDLAADGFHRVGFRRDIELSAVPDSLPVRISADARYVLWVNGREIGRGPVRSQPSRWTYDTYDLASALVAGRNTVAVLVTYYGASNAMWQRANVARGLGSQAALVLDAGQRWTELATGPLWRATRFPAWTTVPNQGMLGALPIEIVDLRDLQDDWVTSSGADSTMPPARIAVSAHPGGGGQGRPPAFPFGRLQDRGIAALSGDVVAPRTVSLTGAELVNDPAVVESVHDALRAAAVTADSAVSLPHVREVTPAAPLLWLIDFGRVVTGLTELDFTAPAGTVLDIAYLERPLEAGGETRYVPRAGARITARDGRTHYRSLESNGFRYVGILVRPSRPGAFAFTRVTVQEQVCRFEPGATFRSSDAELDRLWQAGVRTVQLNSVDALLDCPTREQRAWVGDAAVHIAVHLAANTDWRLVERHLRLADSPRPDGLLPMSVAGDIEGAGGYSIPDWSLHWVHALWLYARSSKRTTFARRRLATAARILAWFEAFAAPDGVLQDVPEWVLIDWSSVSTSGRSAALTALWARGLREYAELSAWLGNPGEAAHAQERLARAERGFEQFWDAERGVYVDQILHGQRMPAVSQAANAAAVAAGIVPVDRVAGIIDRITDESRLVTRSWNAASPSIPLAQKIQDRAAGVQRIDWDVQTEIVRAEPFFSSVVHDAVALAGRADLIPRLVRRWSQFLRDGYDTFGECWEWGTPCHGWSSTPTSDLIVHMLGVRPLDLASDVYLVAPVRTDIEHLQARVPTRLGLLSLQITGQILTVDAPLPIQVVTWTGRTIQLAPGSHQIDLLSRSHPEREPASTPVAAST